MQISLNLNLTKNTSMQSESVQNLKTSVQLANIIKDTYQVNICKTMNIHSMKNFRQQEDYIRCGRPYL